MYYWVLPKIKKEIITNKKELKMNKLGIKTKNRFIFISQYLNESAHT